MADDDLSGFERGSFTHAGTTHELLRCGSGPAVIVIAEMPGITPKVLAFARMVAGIGCSAVLPVLFGEPGRDPVPRMPNPLAALIYAGDSILRACISHEFTVWASGKSSPVVDWLRALAVFEHERCGGPGVGAIGMCFTGGYGP
jgi:dienelactone hydrolase